MMTSAFDFLKKISNLTDHVMPLYSSLGKEAEQVIARKYLPDFTLEDFDFIEMYQNT
jgi:hypothetical protein